jgi:hypothetical protein
MVKVVHKFSIDLRKTAVEMPLGSKILSVQLQDGSPTLWALVDPEAMKEIRHFRVLMTGEHFTGSKDLDYLATLQNNGIVAHVFEDRFYHNKT